ncbi:hypothetical protein DPMN_163984 [Dreissena polymorpha]|uniref:Uncharacterized protein n=1 Tax=Dreissena polymorpha TaxID=45954 RepID=A0A9D4ES54_DREPO|nr:hypothetical protein DPMN_163984 [Dreissena polymorpha]
MMLIFVICREFSHCRLSEAGVVGFVQMDQDNEMGVTWTFKHIKPEGAIQGCEESAQILVISVTEVHLHAFEYNVPMRTGINSFRQTYFERNMYVSLSDKYNYIIINSFMVLW